MTMSLRLSEELERGLEQAAREEGVSKSELVRRCLADYLGECRKKPTAWELGRDLAGKYDSGRSDVSSNRKRIVKEKIHARKGRR